MAISQKCIAVAASLLVAAGQAVLVNVQVVNAQIINASAPTSNAGVQTAVDNAETEGKKGGILPVSWPSISLPTITMPQFTMPQITMPKWPTNTDGTAVSPFAPITAGMSKISAGTKKAWEGAKEMFSFGSDDETARPAASSSEPSFWQRMFGKEPEPEGPRTVAEFMAQPRVGN